MQAKGVGLHLLRAPQQCIPAALLHGPVQVRARVPALHQQLQLDNVPLRSIQQQTSGHISEREYGESGVIIFNGYLMLKKKTATCL